MHLAQETVHFRAMVTVEHIGNPMLGVKSTDQPGRNMQNATPTDKLEKL